MDTSMDYVSEDDEELEPINRNESIIAMIIMSFVSVTGTAGNALVLYVFSRRKDRLVSTLFILSLAIVDFSTCLFVVPFTIYMEYANFRIEVDFLCKLYHFLITCNVPFSAMVMVAIAIDRYFCICHPWLNAIDGRVAKRIVIALSILAVALGICVASMYGIYQPVVICQHPGCGEPPPVNYTNRTTFTHYTAYSAPCHDVIPHHEIDVSNLSHAEFLSVDYVKTCTCDQNYLLLNKDFQWYYHKMHMSMYVVCFVAVAVLYVAIYWSVLKRRRKRQRDRRRTLPTETYLALSRSVVAGDAQTSNVDGRLQLPLRPPGGSSFSERDSPPSTNGPRSINYDGNFVANLKTAAMLFVVTVVFVVTFLPAWLMIMKWMPFRPTIFYLYFANNAANPVIYSFMNRNFRDSLKRLLVRKRAPDRTTVAPPAVGKSALKTDRPLVVV